MTNWKIKDARKAKSYEGGSSKGRLDIQYKPMFKKRFSNHVASKLPKARDNRVLTLSPKMEMVKTYQVNNLLVQSVERSIWVNA